MSRHGDEVRALLAAGIADEVTDYDYERGLALHLQTISAVASPSNAGSAPGGSPPSSPGAASSLGAASFIGVPLASALAVAALWFGSGAETRSAPPTPAAHATSAAPESTSPPTANAAVTGARPIRTLESLPRDRSAAGGATHPMRASAVGSLREAASLPPKARGVATASPGAVRLTENGASRGAPPALDAPPVRPQASSTPVFGLADATEPAPSTAELAEREASEARAEQSARVEAARAAQEAADSRLALEMAMLVDAKRALGSDPARALALSLRAQREFGSSLFAEEREHVLLLALVALGRVDEARRAAAPYLRAHPDSPFARRVRRALAAPPSP
jgi:hypothetical protein